MVKCAVKHCEGKAEYNGCGWIEGKELSVPLCVQCASENAPVNLDDGYVAGDCMVYLCPFLAEIFSGVHILQEAER